MQRQVSVSDQCTITQENETNSEQPRDRPEFPHDYRSKDDAACSNGEKCIMRGRHEYDVTTYYPKLPRHTRKQPPVIPQKVINLIDKHPRLNINDEEEE